MTLKIEVGDKVRIVAEGVYGHGQQGTVMQGPDSVGGYLVRLRCDNFCWYFVDEIALFADELEDMPEDTVVTWKGAHGFRYEVGGTVFDDTTPSYVAAAVRTVKGGTP